ncbi:MAG TPA: hypothetical protein VFR24_22395 [Candidatus Angelobacter sp.]|nr:hypothetical protein [Candidatus Angelobacter sp.]
MHTDQGKQPRVARRRWWRIVALGIQSLPLIQPTSIRISMAGMQTLTGYGF